MPGTKAFTLVELLVVLALIAVLAAMLLPALESARARATGYQSVNNTRQLVFAWMLYADDASGRLPYNCNSAAGGTSPAQKTNLNWVNNLLTWDLDSDNTNRATLTEASLGTYASRATQIYRCPNDRALSKLQREAGWTHRVRSYSMNAMIGDAGEPSNSGGIAKNANFVQFFRITDIPQPADIFVFVEEHPDSIDDGYFFNRSGARQWTDLPSSDHDGAAPLAFADGHAQLHRWVDRSTRQPLRPKGVDIPQAMASSETSDLNWVLTRTSIKLK